MTYAERAKFYEVMQTQAEDSLKLAVRMSEDGRLGSAMRAAKEAVAMLAKVNRYHEGLEVRNHKRAA